MLVMDDLPLREKLVATVRRRIGEIAPPYREALLAVDRAAFARREDVRRAWIDEPLPLDTPHGRGVATVSAPHIYVIAFEALGLGRGDQLLEMGSGSGYGAALAAHVVGTSGTVTTVEADPHLARIALQTTARIRNVQVLHDDGLRRPDLVARAQKTWLTFSVNEPPQTLLDAVTEGSVLLAPVAVGDEQHFLRFTRRAGEIVRDDLGVVRFVHARALIEE